MGRARVLGTTVIFAACAARTAPGPPAAGGQVRCAWEVCVYSSSVGGSVLYRARNGGPVAATVSLSFGGTGLSNLSSPYREPIVRTVAAGADAVLARLTRVDPAAPTRAHAVVHIDLGSDASEPDASVLYSMPFAGSEHRTLIAAWGSPTHLAENRYSVDFAMPAGTPVVAARAGVVVEVQDGFTEGGPDPELIDRGNLVALAHADGTMASYGHLSAGITVAPGDSVARGQLLGFSGGTGFSSVPHLHFHVGKRLMGGGTRTIPVRFAGPDGTEVRLETGRAYAPAEPRAAPRSR